MNSLNSIIMEGNLVRKPETVISPKGTAICKFSVATNRYFKIEGEDQKEVSFFDIEVWSTLAENCDKFLDKGRGVRIVGRLKQDRWVDKKGKNQAKVKIVGEHVEFKPQFSKGDNTDKKTEVSEKEFEELKV